MQKPVNLPQEILIEIFSWLPAKSVGKCRCLAKSWRTRLSAPQFIESHLHRRRDPETIIITTSSHSIHSIKDDAVPRKLEFPEKFEFVLGSCNGLVLLVDDKYNMFLVNPTTMQQVKIPYLPLPIEEGGCVGGFGYDSFTDDYKVVHLCFCGPNCDYGFVDVYSLKRGIWYSLKRVWKRVHKTPYNHAIPALQPGAFVKGAIHWLSLDFPCAIIAFNLVNEVFDEIPVPVVDSEYNRFCGLVVLGGCLCIFERRCFSQMGFWVMKEYGVRESWTKFSIDVDFEWSIVKPLCFVGDENVALLTRGHSIVVHNLKDRTSRNMFVGVIDGTTSIESFVSRLDVFVGVMDGTTFIESLVSPRPL